MAHVKNSCGPAKFSASRLCPLPFSSPSCNWVRSAGRGSRPRGNVVHRRLAAYRRPGSQGARRPLSVAPSTCAPFVCALCPEHVGRQVWPCPVPRQFAHTCRCVRVSESDPVVQPTAKFTDEIKFDITFQCKMKPAVPPAAPLPVCPARSCKLTCVRLRAAAGGRGVENCLGQLSKG